MYIKKRVECYLAVIIKNIKISVLLCTKIGWIKFLILKENYAYKGLRNAKI